MLSTVAAVEPCQKSLERFHIPGKKINWFLGVFDTVIAVDEDVFENIRHRVQQVLMHLN